MEKSLEEQKEALQEVRKAHRLIYEYQDWVQSLMLHIKSKYGMNLLTAKQRFCAYHQGVHDYGDLRVHSAEWAWDYLQTYEVEYYFDYKSAPSEEHILYFFVLQVTDTGWHQKRGDKCKLDSFEEAEKSHSVFMFYAQCTDGGGPDDTWKTDMDAARDELLGQLKRKPDENEFEPYVNAGKSIYAMMFPMECFASLEQTDEKLKEFREGVKRDLDFKL